MESILNGINQLWNTFFIFLTKSVMKFRAFITEIKIRVVFLTEAVYFQNYVKWHSALAMRL